MNGEKEHKIMPYKLFPSTRLFMIFLTFCGFATLWCSFATFNFAIVCMVNSTLSDAHVSTNSSDQTCVDRGFSSADHTDAYGGHFLWDRQTQSNLLAAYAWGAVWMSIPSGWVSDRYGSKYVFCLCIMISTVSTALVPWAAYKGAQWVFVARLFAGLAAGAGFPCAISVVTRWSTTAERSTFVALVNLGIIIGQLMTVATSGLLCASSLKWPFVFYIWACFGALVLLLWTLVYTDHPSQCRFISEEELRYLKAAKSINSSARTKANVPWKRVFFSPPACAIYMCNFCNVWNFTLLNEFVPIYIKEILRMDSASNGIFSAMPLLVQVAPCFICGILADRLVCGNRSTTFSVKCFNTLCMGVPCVGLLTLTFLDCHTNMAIPIFCLCLCAFFYATSVASFMRSMVLIAPRFSGTISSVSNVWSYAASIVLPYAVGAINQNGTSAEWRMIFYMCLAVSLFGCITFLAFGSGEEQEWARDVSATGAVEPRPPHYEQDILQLKF